MRQRRRPMLFGGGMYNPYTVRYKIGAMKAAAAALAGALLWAWTTFGWELPTGEPSPRPAVTQTTGDDGE